MKTATPRLARAINDRLVLDLLIERGPLTAPQLRALTGLSRPTVSDLIERLQANGLIEVTGESGGDRRGPNARLYGIAAGRAHVAGVDVRRAAVHVTVADIAGRTTGEVTRPAEGEPAALIAGALAEAAGPYALHAVVVGAPGLVDPRTGDLSPAGDLPFWRPDMLQALRGLIDAPVVMENEVNLAAVAEQAAGAAAGREDFVLLWLDEGVGSAVVLGGKVRRGVSGGAGELGYLKVGDTAACDLLDNRVVPGLADEVIAGRVAAVAQAAVVVLDPGLVVLAGRTGVAGGDKLAAMVAEHLTPGLPVPVQVRPSAVAGNPVLHGAVLSALEIARDAVFSLPT